MHLFPDGLCLFVPVGLDSFVFQIGSIWLSYPAVQLVVGAENLLYVVFVFVSPLYCLVCTSLFWRVADLKGPLCILAFTKSFWFVSMLMLFVPAAGLWWREDGESGSCGAAVGTSDSTSDIRFLHFLASIFFLFSDAAAYFLFIFSFLRLQGCAMWYENVTWLILFFGSFK